MRIAEVEDAKTEVLYPLEIRFRVKREGQDETDVLKLKYRPITQEMASLLLRNTAKALALIIAEWEAEEPLTEEFLAGRPMRFLNRLAEEITSDYFPK